jgi:hypothetical protein
MSLPLFYFFFWVTERSDGGIAGAWIAAEGLSLTKHITQLASATEHLIRWLWRWLWRVGLKRLGRWRLNRFLPLTFLIRHSPWSFLPFVFITSWILHQI